MHTIMFKKILILVIAIGLFSYKSFAEPGDLLAEFDIAPKTFLSSPSSNTLFVALEDSSVVPLSIPDLTLGKSIDVGGIPSGMALSWDKQLLYVTLSNISSVAVIDLATWTLQPEIRITRPGDQIAVDNKNRLYIGSVDRNEDIMVYDPLAGGVTEPIPFHCSICYRPLLQMSDDGKTLYGANRGLSPATLAIYNVSGDVPNLVSDRRDLGSNGQDLHLTDDNQHLYFAVGGGNGPGYSFAKIEVETGDILGYMETGAYPRQVTTSPDGVYFYAVHTQGHIDVWNAETLAQITQYDTIGEARDIITDLSGDYLVAAFDNALRVYQAEGKAIIIDEDIDGIDDALDNCIGQYNPEQQNSDNDSLGDACDPFPFEENHEFAQCNVDFNVVELNWLTAIEDLANCSQNAIDLQSENASLLLEVSALQDEVAIMAARIAELETELEEYSDSDADGVPDVNDACANTPLGTAVNNVGCELPPSQIVQAESYARYHDTTVGNAGGQYLTDDVDIQSTSDIGGGYNIGWTVAGEWLEYDIQLPAGDYIISARVASNVAGSSFGIELSGQQSEADVGMTGSWQSWKDLTIGQYSVTAETSTLRVYITGSGVNLNWIEITPTL